jgi:Nif-specific regulatory protein
MTVSPQIYESEVNTLCEIGRIVGQVLDLDFALEEVLKTLSRSLAVEWAVIALLDKDSGELTLRATYGLRPSERKKGICRLSGGIVDLIFKTAQPFILPRSCRKPLFSDAVRSVGREEIAFFGAPIVIQEKTVGFIVVDSLFSGGIPSEENTRFLAILAKFIAQFIDLNHKAKAWEKNIERRNQSLLREISEAYAGLAIVGRNHSMLQLRAMVEKLAPSSTPVMLLGERGTEKALVARIIHDLSHYANGPFIRLGCTTLEDGDTDSELLSRFEMAETGTVFLEDVENLPAAMQGILVSLVRNRKPESREMERERKMKTGVRIIAAADKDLAEAVMKGSFRQDLYYRLNAFPLYIPPLRERKEDIPLLAEMFLRKAAREYGQRPNLTPAGLRILKEHSWPGNTHELEHFIGYLAMMRNGPVIAPDTLRALLMGYSSLRALCGYGGGCRSEESFAWGSPFS